MTQDELFKEFVQFVAQKDSYSAPYPLARQLIYWKVKKCDKASLLTFRGSGILDAFVMGIHSIDPDTELREFDTKLVALADELLRHLKAELS